MASDVMPNGNGENVKVSRASPAKVSLRNAIFNSDKAKPKKELAMFYGQEVELRQPTLEHVLTSSDEEGKMKLIDNLIACAFVPGTDELVFDETDRDGLLALPFGPDLADISTKIAELMSVDFQEPSKGSDAAAS